MNEIDDNLIGLYDDDDDDHEKDLLADFVVFIITIIIINNKYNNNELIDMAKKIMNINKAIYRLNVDKMTNKNLK